MEQRYIANEQENKSEQNNLFSGFIKIIVIVFPTNKSTVAKIKNDIDSKAKEIPIIRNSHTRIQNKRLNFLFIADHNYYFKTLYIFENSFV